MISYALAVVLALIVATGLGLLLTPLVRDVAMSRGLVDAPGGRRVNAARIPRGGGIAVVAAATGAAVGGLLLGSVPASLFGATPEFGALEVLLVVGLTAAIGLWDDVRGASPRGKLLLTIGVGLLAWLLGFRLDGLTVRYVGTLAFPWLSLPLSVLWVVGVIHAVNLIDGLDGLAGGLAVIAFGAIGASAVISGRGELVVVSAAFIGALLAFLRFNRHPATIFLGDAGSLPLGAALALLAPLSSERGQHSYLGVFTFLVLGYPLLDTALAIIRRWLRGVRFSQADRRHIHHQLLAKLGDQRAVVRLIHIAAGTAAFAALVLRHGNRDAVLLTLGAVVVAAVVLAVLMASALDYHELLIAAAVAASFGRNSRRALSEKINARDVAQRVGLVTSLTELDDLLAHVQGLFAIDRVELCRQSARRVPSEIAQAERAVEARFWRLDWPVSPNDGDPTDPIVLRCWVRHNSTTSPVSVGRLAMELAPALERNLALPVLHELWRRNSYVRQTVGRDASGGLEEEGRASRS